MTHPNFKRRTFKPMWGGLYGRQVSRLVGALISGLRSLAQRRPSPPVPGLHQPTPQPAAMERGPTEDSCFLTQTSVGTRSAASTTPTERGPIEKSNLTNPSLCRDALPGPRSLGEGGRRVHDPPKFQTPNFQAHVGRPLRPPSEMPKRCKLGRGRCL